MNEVNIKKTEKEKETKSTFWKTDLNGKVKINQVELTKFLQKGGFYKITSKSSTSIVRVRDNKVTEVADYQIVDYVKEFLLDRNEYGALETFSMGIPNYLNIKKLDLLDTVEIVKNRDSKECSWFYFKNIAVKVTIDGIATVDYKDLSNKIWESRILNREFKHSTEGHSDFEQFIFNLAGRNDDRFLALKSNIGFLLHRYQNPSNTKAVILVDENISLDDTANGGTGKTLVTEAIGKMRELVGMDGKNIKGKSWFKNQRITKTTDVVRYDDVQRGFDFEKLYSMITSGVTIEKKYQDEFQISFEDAPKIVLSSNYPIMGTGGNSDNRRRCEFEVANHYSENYQPIDEFGHLFFNDWNSDQWNQFDKFMMSCVITYLENDLIIAEPINLSRNKLVSGTSPDFVEFMDAELSSDIWIDKRDFHSIFINQHPKNKDVTSHKFTKWLKDYAVQSGLIYEDKSSGGIYSFRLKTTLKISGKNE